MRKLILNRHRSVIIAMENEMISALYLKLGCYKFLNLKHLYNIQYFFIVIHENIFPVMVT